MINNSEQRLGNYQLIRRLGQGGFADIYLGEHIYLKTLAAIKVLKIQLTDDVFDQFLNEARVIARLTHPKIVHVLEFGIEYNTPYLVMNYAPHGSLRQRYPIGSILPIDTVVFYVEQIAQALQYAHDRQVIHRDVKPENMLIDNDSAIMLTDFGLAITTQNSYTTQTQQGVDQNGTNGTVTYMAPEQFNGQFSAASDQYALGIVAYEWLCGAPPFEGPTNMSIGVQHLQATPPPMRAKNPALDPAIEMVVLRALAKDPQARFPSIEEFARALEDVSAPTMAVDYGIYANTSSLSLAPFQVGTPQMAFQPTERQRAIMAQPVLYKAKGLQTSIPRRTFIFGLAGLAGLGLAGMGIASLVHLDSHSQTKITDPTRRKPVKSAPTAAPTTPATILGAATRPTVASWGSGHMDLFVRGSDNSLWHRSYNSSWHPWEPLGGLEAAIAFDPSVAAWGPGRIDLFVRGANNALLHKMFDGSWHDWESFGNSISADPSAVASMPGRIDVFGRGDDMAMYHLWYDGSWHPWEPLGGVLTSAPAAAGIAGQVHAFVRGSDTALWHKWFDGTWHDWEPLGGSFVGDPAASASATGRLDVFVRGNDNTLLHKWYDGTNWHDWESLGGSLASAPTAVTHDGITIDVFARTTDNTLQHIRFDGTWQPWEKFV
jgi:serine/threonine protein kinase